MLKKYDVLGFITNFASIIYQLTLFGSYLHFGILVTMPVIYIILILSSVVISFTKMYGGSKYDMYFAGVTTCLYIALLYETVRMF